MVDFFQNLFTSSTLDQIDVILKATPVVVMEEMNLELSATFVRAKLDAALQQMESLKLLGPDGMPPLFFQQFWSTKVDEVANAILTCLNPSSITPSINQTFITLIPKVKISIRVSKYRPIAL